MPLILLLLHHLHQRLLMIICLVCRCMPSLLPKGNPEITILMITASGIAISTCLSELYSHHQQSHG